MHQPVGKRSTDCNYYGRCIAREHAERSQILIRAQPTCREPTPAACRYYGYRLADAFDEDPRLQALDAAWFAGKRVLDVGCNEGVLTLSLACKFACKAALGVDIDAALVAKASRSLAALRGQYTRQLTTPGLGAGCAPHRSNPMRAARRMVLDCDCSAGAKSACARLAGSRID